MLKAQPSRFESTDKLQGEERGLMDCCCCDARAECKKPRTLFTRPPLDGNTRLIPNEAPLKATCITLQWGMTFWVLSCWGLISFTPCTAPSKEKIIKWCICCKPWGYFFVLRLQGFFLFVKCNMATACIDVFRVWLVSRSMEETITVIMQSNLSRHQLISESRFFIFFCSV